jgi:hypothetical protein
VCEAREGETHLGGGVGGDIAATGRGGHSSRRTVEGDGNINAAVLSAPGQAVAKLIMGGGIHGAAEHEYFSVAGPHGLPAVSSARPIPLISSTMR